MPNIKSAKKRVKTDAKKKIQNRDNASGMRTAIKKVRSEVKNNNKEQANSHLSDAIKKIDKALNSGLIKKNKAARDKSKLMKSVNKVN